MLEFADEVVAVHVLAKCEEAVSVLYTKYAQCDPELALFWHKLAQEELAHRAWVYALADKVAHREVSFQEGRFMPEAFQNFLAYLQQFIAEVDCQGITPFSALSIAVDIERNVVERHFYEIFTGNTAEAEQLLGVLASSAREHYELVQVTWERYRIQHEHH